MPISLGGLALEAPEHFLIADCLEHLLRFLNRHGALRHDFRLASDFLSLRIRFAGLLVRGTQCALRSRVALLVFRFFWLLRFIWPLSLVLWVLFGRRLSL